MTELIRNFSIIAHIDHGKTTLSDRLLERTGALAERDRREQALDSMDLEREKGITIKAKAVRLEYSGDDGQTYELNLIDCPGHVDFSYEVSRALAACEGALLVVDAAQGIEAQTLANVYMALEHDLTIIPVINKIDLPGAEPELVAEEIERVLGLPAEEVIMASAKEGVGVDEILEAIVRRIPPPKGDPQAPLRALIFDSHYNAYKGVIAYIRVMEGELKTGDEVVLMGTGVRTETLEIGVFRPQMMPVEALRTGETGYIATGLKNVGECQVGDTVTVATARAAQPLSGYRPAKPMVFAGIYPVDATDYPLLRDALEKLKLNDAALTYVPETSAALGFGFRAGFLGLLHMEIVQERLEREYNLNLLITAPSVEYQVLRSDGEIVTFDNPSEMPDPSQIDTIEEPVMQISIIVPSRYIGPVMELVTARRGTFQTMDYLDEQRVVLKYGIPLAEIVVDFYDQLKSRTQGYASLDYTLSGYQAADLVKLDILVNAVPVDALSMITHRENAHRQGRQLVEKLRSLIPRQMFEVPIQAAIGAKIVARETVRAMRKDVLAKCYGGDVSRKRKLLEKQKEGKRRMKMVGNVEIPQEAFMAVLSLDND
ncbi:MAG: Translation elongation factor LepA [uncultured Chloroflexia bacterium]|uniref:Elongation factor 4 n=1 Tax=uncultured Chloroflexia bacterium TaxID=1672391 RepID=A0A6J4H6I2_9CHLR|nr:MAG: Translation elongation factor LepA [uncultured Chloroflexia bacterium]